MLPIRAFLFAMSLFLASCATNYKHVASGEAPLAVSVGALQMQLPAGWAVPQEVNGGHTSTSPSGERLEIVYLRPPQGTPSAVTLTAENTLAAFVSAKQARLEKNPDITVAQSYSLYQVKDGHITVKGAFDYLNADGKRAYTIQYLIAESGKIFMITFDGTGDVSSNLEKFDGILDSVRWPPMEGH